MPDELINPLADLADHLSKLVELAAGHREKAVSAGFSIEVAERMGEAVHNALLTKVMLQSKKKS